MNWITLLLGSIVVGFLGLGDAALAPPSVADRSALVVTWSQSTSDVADLAAVVGPGTLVIETEADRDELLARVSQDLSTEELETVDLTTHLVVAGGYRRCTESSSVESTDDGWRFVVSDGDESVDCMWSPYTIDVWSVPRPSALEHPEIVAS